MLVCKVRVEMRKKVTKINWFSIKFVKKYIIREVIEDRKHIILTKILITKNLYLIQQIEVILSEVNEPVEEF